MKDFAVIQRGKNLVFTFTLPTLATDGEQLTKPLEVELFRRTELPAASTPLVPPNGPPWKRFLERNLVSPSGIATISVGLTDEELAKPLNSTWTFLLRSLTRGFRRRPILSDWSNPVSRTLQNVSEPPAPIHVEVTEKAMILRWPPPDKGIAAGASPAPAGYSIYRSLSGQPGSFELLGSSPTPDFAEAHFQFGTPYYFFVRAVFKVNSDTAESDDSPVVEITPRDTFPPAAPSNVTAVFADGFVDLIWSPNTEADLAGYNVERRENDAEFVKLNSGILATPIYRDTAVEKGARYIYRVRALDRSGNVSEPSAEVEVEPR